MTLFPLLLAFPCRLRYTTKPCSSKFPYFAFSPSLKRNVVFVKGDLSVVLQPFNFSGGGAVFFLQENETVIPHLAEKIVHYHRRQQSDYAGELQQIEKELSGTKREIENLVNALAAGGVAVPSIIERLKGLELKKSKLEVQFQEWQCKAEAGVISVESVTAYLQANTCLLKNKNLDTCKRLVQEFVEKVIVTKEKIEVIFKITVDLNGGGGGNRTHRPRERPQELLRAQAVVWLCTKGRPQPGSLRAISIDLACALRELGASQPVGMTP